MRNGVDLLHGIRGEDSVHDGVKIVVAVTGEPYAPTFIFEGTKQAISEDIFEIPIHMRPIQEGDRFTATKMFGTGPASRWAMLNKMNGCSACLATMKGPSSLQIDGINKIYGPSEVIAPMGLSTGDRVVLIPVNSAGLKYAVIQKLS